MPDFRGRRIGFTVCEDLWECRHQSIHCMQPLPVDKIAPFKPITCSTYRHRLSTTNHAHDRIQLLKETASKDQLPLFTAIVSARRQNRSFDGGPTVATIGGEISMRCNYFLKNN
ncbi:MAG: hypothetical protein IPG01_05880 [Chitinophagaceae bacterium]|nr:hypothetical protein [Chitinophagaceae bacterium]